MAAESGWLAILDERDRHPVVTGSGHLADGAHVVAVDPGPAIAASLFVVAVTNAVALIPHSRARRVQWQTGLVFGTAGLAGAYAGGRLAAFVSATVLLARFGLLIATAAIASSFGPRRRGYSREGLVQASHRRVNPPHPKEALLTLPWVVRRVVNGARRCPA